MREPKNWKESGIVYVISVALMLGGYIGCHTVIIVDYAEKLFVVWIFVILGGGVLFYNNIKVTCKRWKKRALEKELRTLENAYKLEREKVELLENVKSKTKTIREEYIYGKLSKKRCELLRMLDVNPHLALSRWEDENPCEKNWIYNQDESIIFGHGIFDRYACECWNYYLYFRRGKWILLQYFINRNEANRTITFEYSGAIKYVVNTENENEQQVHDELLDILIQYEKAQENPKVADDTEFEYVLHYFN